MRTKVVLRQAVANLGEAGDVVTVAGGYARNFLFPRGLAVAATRGNVKHAETWKNSRTAREARELTQARELKTRIEASPLVVQAQAGPDGKLFGSVTAANIADALTAGTGADVDRHVISLEEPIRSVGLHEVRIPLHTEVVAEIVVEVVATPA